MKIGFQFLRAFLAAFLFGLLATSAFAGFQFVSESSADGQYRAELLYEARPPAPKEPTVVHLEDPREEDGILELTIDGTGVDLDSESAVLAVRMAEFNPADWAVAATVLEFADGTDTAGAEAEAALALAPVRMGPISGVQITVNPEQVADAGGSARRVQKMRIVVKGAAMDPRLRAEEVPIAGNYPELRRLIQNTFVNGTSVTSVTLENVRRERRALTAPPGQFRVTYDAGDEIISVPLLSIGASAGDLPNIGIAHHDDVLPIGGVLGGNAIWFYAPRLHTLNDRTDSVFASVNATTTSMAMVSRPAFATLTPQATEVAIPRSRHYEESNDYERFALYPVQTKFFYHFARYPASGSFASTYTRQLEFNDKLASLDVDFTARFYSHNSNLSFNPDHYADIELGGIALPRVSWEGRAIYDMIDGVTLAAQPAGTISFKHTVPSGTPPTASGADLQFFDYIELRWTGFPRIDANGKAVVELEGDSAPRRVTIGGLPIGTTASDVLLLDVTDKNTPQIIEIQNSHLFSSDGLVAVEFETDESPAAFHLQLASALSNIEAVAAELLPEPSAQQLKGIYVRPPVFAAPLQPLINLRGVNHIVELDPQAAYNAFTGGQESPEAIRRALMQLIENAPSVVPIPWVLLVGHASLDARDYLGLITTPQVPIFIESSVFIIQSSGFMENAVDYPYALLSGDDSLPDAMVGRIPARTVADVDLAVQRILAHDALKYTLSESDRPGLFMASAGTDSIFFEQDQPVFSGLYEQNGNSSIIMYESSYPATTTGWAQILTDITTNMTMNPAGLGLLMYTGHGFNNQWNKPQYMESAKVPNIDTEGKWPIIATFTCLNGYFAFPGNSILTLGEAWLFSTPAGTIRGAIANMAPAGVDYYPSQRNFALSVLDPLALPENQRPRTAGELMAMAQSGFATNYPALVTTLHEILLFGDPASSLALDEVMPTEVHGWMILDE